MFRSGRILLIGIFFVIVFILGSWGFHDVDLAACKAAGAATCSPPLWSAWNHMLDTFALFLRTGSMPANTPIPTPLAVARVIAPFVTVFAVLVTSVKLTLSDLRHDYRVARAQKKAGHVIVCGLGEIGLQIVENLRDAGRDSPDEVVAIDLDAGSTNAVTAERLGAIVIKGNARKPSVLRAAGLDGAGSVVICAGEDAGNIDIALGIKDVIGKSSRPRKSPLLVLVELRDEWLFGRLIDHDKKPLGAAGVDIRLFNTYQNTARLLLGRMTPPPAHDDAVQPIVIIGLGSMGRELAVQLLQAGFAPLDRPTRLIVLDRDAEAAERRLAPVLKPIGDFAEASFRGCDFGADAPDCWNEVATLLREERAAAIVVCLPDDQTSLRVAVEIRARLDELGQEGVPVFVRLGRHMRLGEFVGDMERLQDYRNRLLAFGAYSTILGVDMLFNGRLDQLARRLHETWRGTLSEEQRRTPSPGAEDWDSLAEQYKMSNRRAADHARIKLAQIGLMLTEAKSGTPENRPFTPEQIEDLAQLEHRRWVIERLGQGWRYGPVRDNARRIHHMLVGWSRLGDEDRARNRDAIRRLHTDLGECGREILPIAEADNINIDPSAAPADTEAGDVRREAVA